MEVRIELGQALFLYQNYNMLLLTRGAGPAARGRRARAGGPTTGGAGGDDGRRRRRRDHPAEDGDARHDAGRWAPGGGGGGQLPAGWGAHHARAVLLFVWSKPSKQTTPPRLTIARHDATDKG